MGDSCCAAGSMGAVKGLIEEELGAGGLGGEAAQDAERGEGCACNAAAKGDTGEQAAAGAVTPRLPIQSLLVRWR
jgi:hypothetical protein